MSDDTITRIEAELHRIGFSENHAAALNALLADGDEREALALDIAHAFAGLRPDERLNPHCPWWAEFVAEG